MDQSFVAHYPICANVTRSRNIPVLVMSDDPFYIILQNTKKIKLNSKITSWIFHLEIVIIIRQRLQKYHQPVKQPNGRMEIHRTVW